MRERFVAIISNIKRFIVAKTVSQKFQNYNFQNQQPEGFFKKIFS